MKLGKSAGFAASVVTAQLAGLATSLRIASKTMQNPANDPVQFRLQLRTSMLVHSLELHQAWIGLFGLRNREEGFQPVAVAHTDTYFHVQVLAWRVLILCRSPAERGPPGPRAAREFTGAPRLSGSSKMSCQVLVFKVTD